MSNTTKVIIESMEVWTESKECSKLKKSIFKLKTRIVLKRNRLASGICMVSNKCKKLVKASIKSYENNIKKKTEILSKCK